MSHKLEVVPVWTVEQAEALNGLHAAMGGFFQAVVVCNDNGIPLADAFASIGVEIPLMLRPMVNTLSDKLPTLKLDS
jgi:hypothetical protein